MSRTAVTVILIVAALGTGGYVAMTKLQHPAAADSGITGTVLLGPTCPVIKDPPEGACEDKPYATALEAVAAGTDRVAATFTSDAGGKFRVNLPPGDYDVRSPSTDRIYPHCGTTGTVTVRPHEFTDAAVSCDTGIR